MNVYFNFFFQSIVMALDNAKISFMSLMQNLPESDRLSFMRWLKSDVLDQIDNGPVSESRLSARRQLHAIAQELRTRVPFEGVLSSEKLCLPQDLESHKYLHLDAFLYDEEEEERLVEEGKLARNFCQDCGSRNIQELEYVTHSCSMKTMEFIFVSLLPNLDGKRVLDIGSRLGALLYGAYLFSTAKEIVGLEMNKDFCDMAEDIVSKNGMDKRVQVVNAEMTTVPELVRTADVVILNNVFDWFVPVDGQNVMWNFLYDNIPSGALIVSVPSLKEALKKLKISMNLDMWVRKLNATHPENLSTGDLEEDIEEVHLYQVIKP